MRETLQSILSIMENAGFVYDAVEEDDFRALEKSIRRSKFFKIEGKALALNIIFLANDRLCGVVGVPEFVSGAGLDTLESLNKITGDELKIKNIESGCLMDWEMFDEHGDEELEDGKLTISAKVNGKKTIIEYPPARDIKEDVLDVVDSIRSDFPEEMKNIFVTRTLDETWEEDGAVLICNLPDSCADEIRKLIYA